MLDGQQCQAACAVDETAIGLGTCFVSDGAEDWLVGTPTCLPAGTSLPTTLVEKLWVAMRVLVEDSGGSISDEVFRDGLGVALGVGAAGISQLVVDWLQGAGGRRLGSREAAFSFLAVVPAGVGAEELRGQAARLAVTSSAEQVLLQERLATAHSVTLILVRLYTSPRTFFDEQATTSASFSSLLGGPLPTAAAASPLLIWLVVCSFVCVAACGVGLKARDRKRLKNLVSGALDAADDAVDVVRWSKVVSFSGLDRFLPSSPPASPTRAHAPSEKLRSAALCSTPPPQAVASTSPQTLARAAADLPLDMGVAVVMASPSKVRAMGRRAAPLSAWALPREGTLLGDAHVPSRGFLGEERRGTWMERGLSDGV